MVRAWREQCSATLSSSSCFVENKEIETKYIMYTRNCQGRPPWAHATGTWLARTNTGRAKSKCRAVGSMGRARSARVEIFCYQTTSTEHPMVCAFTGKETTSPPQSEHLRIGSFYQFIEDDQSPWQNLHKRYCQDNCEQISEEVIF